MAYAPGTRQKGTWAERKGLRGFSGGRAFSLLHKGVETLVEIFELLLELVDFTVESGLLCGNPLGIIEIASESEGIRDEAFLLFGGDVGDAGFEAPSDIS